MELLESTQTRTKQSAKIYMRARRHEMRAMGLCHCGNPRRVEGDRQFKMCQSCWQKSAKGNALRRASRTADDSVLEKGVELVKLVTVCDPDVLHFWREFCAEFGMPLIAALEAGMELLMAETRRQEAVEAQQRAYDEHESYISVA